MTEPRKDAPRRWNSTFKVKPPGPQKARKPLQRSGKLKPVSKKNSKPHRDADLVAEYKNEFPTCQLCELIHGHMSRHVLDTDDAHHIWPGSKVDAWSTIIAACRRCHDWCHKHSVDGKWICLFAKQRLGGRHWNLDELNLAARQRVEGWVARPDKQPRLLWVQEWYRDDVLKAVTGDRHEG